MTKTVLVNPKYLMVSNRICINDICIASINKYEISKNVRLIKDKKNRDPFSNLVTIDQYSYLLISDFPIKYLNRKNRKYFEIKIIDANKILNFNEGIDV